MNKIAIAATVWAAFALGAHAQTKPGIPPGDRWCDITSLEHTSASGGVTEDAWGANTFAKLKASSCVAGDIVSIRGFNWQSTAAARFCDFAQTIYTDGQAVVCRWTGKMRVETNVLDEP